MRSEFEKGRVTAVEVIPDESLVRSTKSRGHGRHGEDLGCLEHKVSTIGHHGPLITKKQKP
jgi:hypothetical protein